MECRNCASKWEGLSTDTDLLMCLSIFIVNNRKPRKGYLVRLLRKPTGREGGQIRWMECPVTGAAGVLLRFKLFIPLCGNF